MLACPYARVSWRSLLASGAVVADLTVLSADIMKIPAPEILETRCVMTVIGGEVVFADSSW